MQSSINMNKSIFRNQHHRLAPEKYGQYSKIVTKNVKGQYASIYIVDKWADYVMIYARERGVVITKTIAYYVAREVAHRPFATDPMPILQAELVKYISEALSS